MCPVGEQEGTSYPEVRAGKEGAAPDEGPETGSGLGLNPAPLVCEHL